MAEIAVRKPGVPWWVWLLGALAVAALLWALLARGDNRNQADRTAPITDIAAFKGASPDDLIGRPVRIENAQVVSVTGDRDFWISDGQGGQVLVILDQTATPAQPGIEGRYDVNPGQTLSVYGEVNRAPGWEEAQSRYALNERVRSEFERQQFFIAADRLDISDWRQQKEPVQTQPQQ